MNKAKRLTVEELKALPLGGVAWRESHNILDCGKYGKVDGYHVYPMLVTEAGENGLLGYVDRESERTVEFNNIFENDCFWSKEPEPEQIETGIPIDEALKTYNMYEAEIFSAE